MSLQIRKVTNCAPITTKVDCSQTAGDPNPSHFRPPAAWPETVSDPVQCRPSELFTAFSVAVSRRCLHAFFLHQRTAATPNVWFRLISHFFLHNYLIFFLSLWREPNFWQLNPELAQEIMQRILWLTRMWWSWMQFWQRSYFDATAWYWEADSELSAQKPFWSVSQKLPAFNFHPTVTTALHCQWFYKTCPHCPNSDITGTYYFASGARN